MPRMTHFAIALTLMTTAAQASVHLSCSVINSDGRLARQSPVDVQLDPDKGTIAMGTFGAAHYWDKDASWLQWQWPDGTTGMLDRYTLEMIVLEGSRRSRTFLRCQQLQTRS